MEAEHHLYIGFADIKKAYDNIDYLCFEQMNLYILVQFIKICKFYIRFFKDLLWRIEVLDDLIQDIKIFQKVMNQLLPCSISTQQPYFKCYIFLTLSMFLSLQTIGFLPWFLEMEFYLNEKKIVNSKQAKPEDYINLTYQDRRITFLGIYLRERDKRRYLLIHKLLNSNLLQ